MNSKQNNNKLGTDKIGKLLFEFSLPAIAGILLSSLYNLIDTAFLGQAYTDGSGVAVTTLALPIMLLFIGFTMLPGQGGNSLAAILLGKNKQVEVDKCLGNSLLLLFIFSIVIALAGWLFIDPILSIIGTPENLWDGTKIFIQIQCYGFFFLSMGLGMNNFIRSAGAPKFALLTNIIGVIVCVFLNWLFVIKFNWGIVGSALATIFGQGSGGAFVLCYFLFSKKSNIKLKSYGLFPNIKLMKKILTMGLASFAMNFASTVICVMFNWVIGYYGALSEIGAQGALASIGIAQKIATFAFMPLIGISMGAQPIIGYNYGAQKWKRVLSTFISALTIGVAIGTIFMIICFVFTEQIVNIFGINGILAELASFTLCVYVTFFPLVGFHAVGGSYFQSSGQPIKSAILELTRQVIFLIPLYLIAPQLLLNLGIIDSGLIGAILCPPVADFSSCLLTIVFVIYEIKKLKLRIKNES